MSRVLLIGLILLASPAFSQEFPKPYNSGEDANAVATPAAETIQKLTLPNGFVAKLSAAEPMVQNPIAVTWDQRGRLWVAENYTYGDSKLRFDRGLRDRVLILEDTDGDGVFDSRKVFLDTVQILTSIEVGRGGVWLMCPPQVLFIPDQDGDDIPDGPAQAVLDGFTVGTDSAHNFANGLRWGPDGWLYGRCGGTCPGLVGIPGTPDEARVPIWGGMWRYHPKTKVYETVVTGTTNPWGHDWNSLGELFFINTVNGHFWHSIPGAHYERHTGLDPNPRSYRLIDLHADHWHFDTGKPWQESRDGAANDLGGGHAHTGGMVYLGDNWPAEHRDRFYMINMHGRRLNTEILEREGSGYIARHGKDLVFSSDTWFRPIEVTYGPDGGVYIIDWSDTGECHENNGVHRTSGRIYKITYGTPKFPGTFDLSKKSNSELVELHRHANEWFARQARIVLAGRLDQGTELGDAREGLLKLFQTESDRVVRLRALFSLYVIEGCSQEFLKGLLSHEDEAVRTWSVRFLTDSWPLDGPNGPVKRAATLQKQTEKQATELLPTLVRAAKEDHSSLVRLALASTLQRLPVSLRTELALPLVSHAENAEDHNLPLLIWYGLIPVGDTHPEALVTVATHCQLPTTLTLIARRFTEDVEKNPAPLNELLSFAASKESSPAVQNAVITGMTEALRGWRKAKVPSNWPSFQAAIDKNDNDDLIARARELSVVFGDGRALDEVKKIVLDNKASMEARKAALQTLIDAKPDDLREICEKVIRIRILNVVAAQGLAQFDDPAIGEQLAKAYGTFLMPERPQIISILVSRPKFALPLLKTIERGGIPRTALTSFHVRQLHSLENPEISKLTTSVWGELNDSSEEKLKLIADLKLQLTDEALTKANLSEGRVLFNATCAKCHRLYGEGTLVGPDITGSNRNDLHYLLENIVDPSAVVGKDFRMIIVMLDDGRVLNGVITSQTERTMTLQTLTDAVTIDKESIEETKQTSLSPMPEGLLQNLTPEQIRNLIGYLKHPSQVPLPVGKE
ncbi:MAG TPA: PVC-type heme-binding CxxCH protein [Planctomicrobium sp.]|nr:PVC-type heme-binding CxxCH protein [Planctomicrobium sp.]